MAREIRNSKAADLFSKGAWLPVIKQVSVYDSNNGLYYAYYMEIAGNHGDSLANNFSLPGYVGFEGGHSYLISVWLDGYTQTYHPSYNKSLRMYVWDPASEGGSGYVVKLWEIDKTETVSNYMTHQVTSSDLNRIINARSLQAWTAYSSTPFIMYSSVKKIS